MLAVCSSAILCSYEIKVNDFASSWSDGTAFCAILHRHRPDMFDYTTQVDRAKPLANLQLAFNTAQTQLGVEKLLDPEGLLSVSTVEPELSSSESPLVLFTQTVPVHGVCLNSLCPPWRKP